MNSVTLYNRLIPHHFRHLFIYIFIYFILFHFYLLLILVYIYTTTHCQCHCHLFLSVLFWFFFSFYIIIIFCSILQLLLLMMFHRGNLVKQEEENSIHRYFCFIGKQRWNLPSNRKIKFAMQIHIFPFISHSFIHFSSLSFFLFRFGILNNWIGSCCLLLILIKNYLQLNLCRECICNSSNTLREKFTKCSKLFNLITCRGWSSCGMSRDASVRSLWDISRGE